MKTKEVRIDLLDLIWDEVNTLDYLNTVTVEWFREDLFYTFGIFSNEEIKNDRSKEE